MLKSATQQKEAILRKNLIMSPNGIGLYKLLKRMISVTYSSELDVRKKRKDALDDTVTKMVRAF